MASSTELQKEELEVGAVLSKLKQLTGITIPLEKKVMVHHRLRKRIAELSLEGVGGYLAAVETSAGEQQTFINLLTTNETYFFRTTRIWDHFQTVVLPEFAARVEGRPLRVWSGASATGEEPYSIAMSCIELQRRVPAFRYEITATDIDTNVLACAAKGYFEGRSVDKLKATRPDLLSRYFVPQPPGYAASEDLRRQLRFQKHNLMQELRNQMQFDVVFLRNVLIYFEVPEQIRILQLVAKQMLSGATLLLGESESISQLDVPFQYCQPLIYQRI